MCGFSFIFLTHIILLWFCFCFHTFLVVPWQVEINIKFERIKYKSYSLKEAKTCTKETYLMTRVLSIPLWTVLTFIFYNQILKFIGIENVKVI